MANGIDITSKKFDRALDAIILEVRSIMHYKMVRSMDKLLRLLESDGAINEDEKYDLKSVRKALDILIESVAPFNVKLK